MNYNLGFRQLIFQIIEEMNSLPIGFAEIVLNLQIQREEEQTVQVLQILSKMYKIGYDYYLQRDDIRAMYFQKKLNSVLVESLHPKPNSSHEKPNVLPSKIKKEIKHFQQCQKMVIKQFVQKTQKAQKRYKNNVQADLIKQQENLQNRMLKRVKSSGRMPFSVNDSSNRVL